MLRAVVGDLLGVEISDICRLGVASAEQCMPLLSTLVFKVDQRFVVLSYSQDRGLVCSRPTAKDDLRWDGEIDVDEWLEIADLEDSAEIPDLPFRVCRIIGYLGTGPYDDILVVVLDGDQGRLVMTTTQDIIICTNIEAARGEAELVAKNQQMEIRRESIALP